MIRPGCYVDFWPGPVLPGAYYSQYFWCPGVRYLGPLSHAADFPAFGEEELLALVDGCARGVLAMGGNGLLGAELVICGARHALGGAVVHAEARTEPAPALGFRWEIQCS